MSKGKAIEQTAPEPIDEVARERERCAQVVETVVSRAEYYCERVGPLNVAAKVAEFIRAGYTIEELPEHGRADE